MLKIEIIGNLGADAERKSSAYGDFYTFNVGHNRKFTNSSGVLETRTDWVSCNVNHDITRVLPWLVKGQKVFVRGDVSTRVYEKNGQHFAGLNCNVRELELVGQKEAKPMQPVDPMQGSTPPPSSQAPSDNIFGDQPASTDDFITQAPY